MSRVMKQIEPHVTLFTAEMPYVCRHGDEATMGGRVTGVLRAADILTDTTELPEAENGAYISIDDDVGAASVFITERALSLFEDSNGPLQIDDVILATGRIQILDTVHREKKTDGSTLIHNIDTDYTMRLFAYGLAKIPDRSVGIEEYAE